MTHNGKARPLLTHHPQPLIIKVCGVTRLDDALAALADVDGQPGADWLGFIRWPKSAARYQPLAALTQLLRELRRAAPRPFEAVGVYVNESAETIAREVQTAGLNRVQLHGEEPLSFIQALAARLPAVGLLKALRVRDAASLAAADEYEGIDLLADAYDPALPGGTGLCFDHAMLLDLVRRRRVIVAGGLGPHNVGALVERVAPWGVDVSSGVERAPGVKDPERIREFIGAARQAAASRQTKEPKG